MCPPQQIASGEHYTQTGQFAGLRDPAGRGQEIRSALRATSGKAPVFDW
jgi:hypothetical protein